MSAELAEKYPVLTFSSGPTNSMRGAAYLSGASDAIVVDIGGTTTDIGMLVNGFPRESSVYAELAGIRTNIRMPDVLSLGLGGGSIVETNGDVRIGPQSVGYRITEQARIFGGDVLTATDIAVAAGYADIGKPSRLVDIDPGLVESSVGLIHGMIEENIDRMKISADPVPLVLVGGGAILVGRDIAGVSELLVPEHAAVANAIGASIAQVGGEVDRVYSYEELGRDNAIKSAKSLAIQAAVEAGASADSVEIVEIEEIPLAYVPGHRVRLRVKAAGDLAAILAPPSNPET
jgi:N-methylhydantoinase A/oxoprolinase/acetone carboxylase beta subunit